jgi:hypothetical protein
MVTCQRNLGSVGIKKKFVNIRYIFLLARRAYSWLFQLAQMTYLERQKNYGPDKLRWQEAEEKIRLKQYVSLRSKGRHKYDFIRV